jgi:hypothetical protein
MFEQTCLEQTKKNVWIIKIKCLNKQKHEMFLTTKILQIKILLLYYRFHSMECFLAWILLNKCEHQSSMKLLIRSLDKTPQLLVQLSFVKLIKSNPLLQIWLLEPYVLFTKGVLKEISTEEDELIELAKRTSNSISSQQNSSISFPALKILYKLFDSDSSKQ